MSWDNLKNWRTVSVPKNLALKTPWLGVKNHEVIGPAGQKGTYSVIQTRGDSAFVIALTDCEEIVLVCQERYPVQKQVWGLPGGNVDSDSHFKGAQRELQEETGIIAQNWTYLGEFFPFCGVIAETSHVYLAEKLEHGHPHKKEEDGILEVIKVPILEVKKKIQENEIMDGQSITALAKYFLQI